MMKSRKVSSAGDATDHSTTSSGSVCKVHTSTQQTFSAAKVHATRHVSKQVTRGPAKTVESGVTRKVTESAANRARPASLLRLPATRSSKSTDIDSKSYKPASLTVKKLPSDIDSKSYKPAPLAVKKLACGSLQFKSFVGISKT